jgi:hypothetical protein
MMIPVADPAAAIAHASSHCACRTAVGRDPHPAQSLIMMGRGGGVDQAGDFFSNSSRASGSDSR